MTFRKGDRVSVVGTVSHNQDADKQVFIRIDGHHSDVWLNADTVTMVQPRFDVGDTIVLAEGPCQGQRGEILAMQNDHAWIDLGGGDYCTRTLSSIKRIEQEPQT